MRTAVAIVSALLLCGCESNPSSLQAPTAAATSPYPPPTRITGRVTDMSNRPVNGAQIEMENEDRWFPKIKTDANGTYTLMVASGNTQEGRYINLRASSPGYAPSEKWFIHVDGTEMSLNFVLSPAP